MNIYNVQGIKDNKEMTNHVTTTQLKEIQQQLHASCVLLLKLNPRTTILHYVLINFLSL